MGVRMNTAIGWGMPGADFARASGVDLPDGYGWRDALEEGLLDTGSMRGPHGMPLVITERGDTVADLIVLVGADRVDHVLLMPTIDERRRWMRRDDDMDYAIYRDLLGPHDEAPSDRIGYLAKGHHPYGALRMNQDGTDAPRPRDEDAILAWEQDASLMPGLPPCLRHWLTATGLLTTADMGLLRPMSAIWWS